MLAAFIAMFIKLLNNPTNVHALVALLTLGFQKNTVESTIDKLLKQLEEAAKTAQIGIIDMEELAQFTEPGDLEQLSALQQQIQDIATIRAAIEAVSRAPMARAVLEAGGHVTGIIPDFLVAREKMLAALPCGLMIDHIGRFTAPVDNASPGVRVMHRLLDAGRTWVKLSAPYHGSKTGAPHYADIGALALELVVGQQAVAVQLGEVA